MQYSLLQESKVTCAIGWGLLDRRQNWNSTHIIASRWKKGWKIVIQPLVILDICSKFHVNSPIGCLDIPVWIKVLDWPTDGPALASRARQLAWLKKDIPDACSQTYQAFKPYVFIIRDKACFFKVKTPKWGMPFWMHFVRCLRTRRRREEGRGVRAVFDAWLCRSPQVPERNDQRIDQHVFYHSPKTPYLRLGWNSAKKKKKATEGIVVHLCFSLSVYAKPRLLPPETQLITPTVQPCPPARQKIAVWPHTHTHAKPSDHER